MSTASMPMPTELSHARPMTFETRAVLALFVGTGLAAYAIGPVPVPWLANAGFIMVIGLLLNTRGTVPVLPGTALFVALILYGLALTIGYSGHFSAAMQGYASMPYPVFVFLRYLNLAAFACAYVLAQRMISREGYDRVQRWIVVIGFALAVLALYMYVAQILGLPEPPRTRAATSGGGVQATLFNSEIGGAYRRVLGTFREPSHFAEWIMLPFFASLGYRGHRRWLYTGALGMALLLTLSMTGLAAAGLGFIISVLITNPLRRRNAIAILLAITAGVAGILVLKAVATALGMNVDLFSILLRRTDLLLKGGLATTNRGYIVDFVMNNPPPVFGFGFGNSNVLISDTMKLGVVVSFLSVYLNTMYATGVVGMAILAIFLLRPLWQHPAMVARHVDAHGPMLAAYCGYLVSFAFQSEELNVPCAVTMALLWEGRRLAVMRARAAAAASAAGST